MSASTPRHPVYQQHQQHLLNVKASRRLMIIWDSAPLSSLLHSLSFFLLVFSSAANYSHRWEGLSNKERCRCRCWATLYKSIDSPTPHSHSHICFSVSANVTAKLMHGKIPLERKPVEQLHTHALAHTHTHTQRDESRWEASVWVRWQVII